MNRPRIMYLINELTKCNQQWHQSKYLLNKMIINYKQYKRQCNKLNVYKPQMTHHLLCSQAAGKLSC